MFGIVPLVHQLLDWPDASNAEVSRRVACDLRTVARYRRLIKGLTPLERAVLHSCDEVALNGTLNPAKTYVEEPNYSELRQALPNGSGRALWREYARRRRAEAKPALSYEQFMRRREGLPL